MKMKVLETRQVSQEILVLAWSPKMDLIGLGNKKGEVMLHRLSWQKVWQITLMENLNPVVPEIITWHPEGIFIAVAAGLIAFIIDVECGKILHIHQLSDRITAMNWCPSSYELRMTEVLAAQARQQSDFLRNDLKVQRLEGCLSVLMLGTKSGRVCAYTGGFLSVLCFKASTYGQVGIQQLQSSSDLRTFQFLVNQKSGSEINVCVNQFQNDLIPRLSSVLGPLGFKFYFFLKNWSLIQSELIGLNDQWGRLVDIYQFYMTYGHCTSISEPDEVRVDFMELLLTGMSAVEMEIFLGNTGREKEAKKNTSLINAASTTISDLLRSIKCAIIFMFTELIEIDGFMGRITGHSEANRLLSETKKALAYLYMAALHIQSLVRTYVDVSLHFMHLVMNAIHILNIQEVPDFIEEDADTQRVLEFLQIKVEKDVFEFLLANVTLGCSEDPSTDKPVETEPSDFDEEVYEMFATGVDFIRYTAEIFNKFDLTASRKYCIDYSSEKVSSFIRAIAPTLNKVILDLLQIPVLYSIPFTNVVVPLINIDQDAFQPLNANLPLIAKRTPSIHLDTETNKTHIHVQVSDTEILFFELQLIGQCMMKSVCVTFSRQIHECKYYSDSFVTLVSYDPEDKRNEADSGRTIICQIPLQESIMKQLDSYDIPLRRDNTFDQCDHLEVKSDIHITIPTDMYKPGPTPSPFIDHILPIESYAPSLLSVSGTRNVGALLDDTRHSILLMEMEPDASESSYDDDGQDTTEGSCT